MTMRSNVRQALLAPPFADVAQLLASSPVQEKADCRPPQRLAATLQRCFEGPYCDCKAPVLGPAPAAIQMMNKKYRYQVSFRAKDDHPHPPADHGRIARLLCRPFQPDGIVGGGYQPLLAIIP